MEGCNYRYFELGVWTINLILNNEIWSFNILSTFFFLFMIARWEVILNKVEYVKRNIEA